MTPETVQPLFRLRGLRCTYGGKGGVAIDGLDIPRGRRIAILGPSGSGKSTLLYLLGGLLRPEKGTLEYDGRPQADRLPDQFGFIFQQPNLLRDAPITDNLELGIAPLGRAFPPNKPDFNGLWHYLQLQNVDPSRRARTLSGGQEQRVAVGRAMLRDPAVILADEPTASLDPDLARQVMQSLSDWQIAQRDRRSLLFITHAPELAERYSDLIIAFGTLPESGVGELAKPEADQPRPTPAAPYSARQPDAEHRPVRDWISPAASNATVQIQLRRNPSQLRRNPSMPFWIRLGFWLNFSEGRFRLVSATSLGMLGLMLIVAVALHYWGWTLLPALVASVGLALPIAIPGLAPTVKARGFILLTLCLAGFAALLLKTTIETEARKRLESPELAVIMLQGRTDSPNHDEAFVGVLQAELEQRRLVPPADGRPGNRAVHGRIEVPNVSAYIPHQSSEQAADAVPQCLEVVTRADDPRALGGQFTLLGLSRDEPVLRGWRWQARPEGTPEFRTEWAEPGTPPPPSMRFTQRDEELLPQPRDPGPIVEVPHVYATETALRAYLQRNNSTIWPRWICIEMAPAFRNDFRPFKLVGIIERIPNRSSAEIRLAVSEAVARRMRDLPGGPPLPYSLLALRLDGALDLGRHHELAGWVESEATRQENGSLAVRFAPYPRAGFDALRQALDSAAVNQGLAVAAGWLVLGLSVTFAALLTWLYIVQSERQLLVARAFGASRRHIWLLLSTLIGIPFLFAWAGTGMIAYAGREWLNEAILAALQVSPVAASRLPGLLGLLLVSGALLIGIGTAVVAVVWWYLTRSISKRLQEVS
jgi:ABC-type lipoprotein export system ATPase subunit